MAQAQQAARIDTVAPSQAAAEQVVTITGIGFGARNVRITVGGIPVQSRRPGAPDLVVTVTNSNAAVAEIDQNGGLNGAQVQTARIVAGQSSTPFNAAGGLEFDPLGIGSTVVTATIPNVTTLPATGFAVNVTP